ncbi:acyl-CoA dehydrogenase family protein [Roseibium aggregatum]|uniref:Pimeloyl-CoA dehydrogenase small subunit n=1 Tax=Roseibium aggregatum TaxID=187304 RepID=A0A926NZ65_9HYPH|nr:acyl-CoA dehydrogenase family protein [Roseibium aggregatum]MBD1546320.1 pimeloyl-CoA dehydrogenase small subunit [Roseibium aggregatum]
MDFDLNEEQRLIKDSVERLLADRYGFEQRKAHGASERGWSADMWAQYADLGLLAMPFSADDGGMDQGPVGTMIVMEAFGRALALEPYLATVVLGGGFLRNGANAAQKADLIPQIVDGSLTLAFAQTERHSRYDLADVTTTARKDGGSYVLDGAKSVVVHGDSADKLIVTARVAGDRRDRSGIGVFLVDGNAAGVSRRGYPTQDGQRAAEVLLEGVRVEADWVIGEPENGLPLIEQVTDEAIAALCAEAVGTMSVMHETTVDYLKTRKQFGVPIGDFQVLQHRAADMFLMLEQARSMSMLATMMADEQDVAERRRSIAGAKVQIGRSGRFVGQQAVQLHGGVGMTMELAVGHYFKRVTMIDTAFGDADYHLSRLADAGGLIAA